MPILFIYEKFMDQISNYGTLLTNEFTLDFLKLVDHQIFKTRKKVFCFKIKYFFHYFQKRKAIIFKEPRNTPN